MTAHAVPAESIGTQSMPGRICRLVAAVILAQTLFFKFTGAPEAVHIFTTLGVEPWGRIALGVVELLTAVGLLLKATRAFAGATTVGLMVGAVGSHLGPLGIEVQGDSGALFFMALVTLACGAVTTWVYRRELPIVGKRFAD